MMQLFLIAGAALLALLSVIFFTIGHRINNADKALYSELREISGKNSPLAVLRGDVRADREGMRDYNVAAGMAIDLKSKKIVNQGKLSAEAVNAIIS